MRYRKNRKYTKEVLDDHVKNVYSFAALIKSFGLDISGGNYRYIHKQCRFFEIDTSHFKGKGWSKGFTNDTNDSVATVSRKNSLTFEEMFCENSQASSSKQSFRKKAIENGIPYICKECGNKGFWNNKSLVLHLDHINGVCNDNRLENLRFLCPNCHQQTPTWGHK